MTINDRDLNETRERLRIDEDDIDRMLVEHSEYFKRAGDYVTDATASYDALKLELKELTAQLDQDIRKNAQANDEKLSEAALSNRIIVLPKIKDLNRKLLTAKKRMDDATNLKESFQQRSYMLRGLNDSANARLYALGVERGASAASRRMGERNRERIDRQRTENDRGMFERRGSNTERYRPKDQDS